MKPLIYSLCSFLGRVFDCIIAPERIIEPVCLTQIDSATAFERVKPLSLKDLHRKFLSDAPGITEMCEPTFINVLKKVRVFSPKGSVINRQNQLVRNSTSKYSSLTLGYRIRVCKSVKLSGLSLLLAADGAESNYFHWLTDSLPKLAIVQKSNFKIEQFDHFLVSNRIETYQRESLKKLDLPDDKLISLKEHKNLKCESLVMPSATCLSGNVSPWIVKWLRSVFRDWMVVKNNSPKKIFVGRGNTSKRKLLNEVELRAFLSLQGYEYVNPGDMSLNDQVNLFYNATHIVAAHGAALTNVIFCRPDCILVELFPVTYVNQCYWTIASIVGLRYGYLLGEGKDFTDSSNHLIDGDFVIDLENLRALMIIMKI